ncbi:hypothetical protein DE146DRAFT_642733 [Phaeosphaeria sp. MPI-PUGE-AT-0046c]|nr:hypothetical protein DE146DRAFT_642733 [Phaeosphaeria sp. MPI-PUGE-AT-0046c]
MVLANFNELAAARFRARKTEQEVPITLALWSWHIDQKHCLSSRNPHVRCNLLLAILKLSSPKLAANLGRASVQFARAFLNAWMLNSTREPISGTDDQCVQCA